MLSSTFWPTGLIIWKRMLCNVTAAQTMHSVAQELKEPLVSTPRSGGTLHSLRNSSRKRSNVWSPGPRKVTRVGSITARTKSVRTSSRPRTLLRRKLVLAKSWSERRVRQRPSAPSSWGQSSRTRSRSRVFLRCGSGCPASTTQVSMLTPSAEPRERRARSLVFCSLSFGNGNLAPPAGGGAEELCEHGLHCRREAVASVEVRPDRISTPRP
mmetsp:Transcript_34757/g.104770  ORF Transcript_34757/g.104770 Transcript_34757/m.104770 type:complete len:212 (-) Transcript_34757:1160-1795(-)